MWSKKYFTVLIITSIITFTLWNYGFFYLMQLGAFGVYHGNTSELTGKADNLGKSGEKYNCNNKEIVRNNESTTEKIKPAVVFQECPEVPPGLVGRIEVITSPVPRITDLEKEYDWVHKGGHYSPPCHQKQHIALIVPYRNRPQQLPFLLKHMHPFLKKQQRNYTIFIIEQNDTLRFNRGQLMNIGYLEASKLSNFTHFIFHDVDYMPEDDRIIYECNIETRHLISSIRNWNYTLYPNFFGGVVCMENETYREINGFPNRYWGWGGEDDDFLYRLQHLHYTFVRYPASIGRYLMLEHKDEWENPDRYKLRRKATEYMKKDGINSVKYTLKSIQKLKLYTKVSAELHKNKL